MSNKIAKWDRWYAVIRRDLSTFAMSRQVFVGTMDIVRQNQDLPQSAFWEHLHMWHAHFAVMAIRRQLKPGSNNISLAGLLTDMKSHANQLNREWYRSLFTKNGVADLADHTFDQVAGPGQQAVNAASIEDDLIQLRRLCAMVETFADRQVAHSDSRGVTDLPTWTDVDAAARFCDHIVKKYDLMLRGNDSLSIQREPIHDWKRVFRVPWQHGAA